MRSRLLRPLPITLILIGALAGAAFVFLAVKWPFSRNKIVAAMAEASGSEVRIRKFHKFFFPRPGCIAEGVVVYRGTDLQSPPLITVERVSVFGDYSRLATFSRNLSEVRADGVRLLIPRKKYPKREAGGSRNAIIDRFVATRSQIAFESEKPGAGPFQIDVHKAVLAPVSAERAITFETSLAVPEPPGEVKASGRFGPWQKNDPYQTPVSGAYTFQKADLGKFEGLAGILASTGRFNGTVANIAVNGKTEVPNFEITSTSHALPVATEFRAAVNGRTGDVLLKHVAARISGTEVLAEGAVASQPDDDGKTVSLDMRVNGGRIQDLLRLVNSGPPKLTGAVNLRFKVLLPPGDLGFLRKLRLTGEMGVGDAKFTTGETQQKLEHISRNADPGEDDPADVVSNLKGRIFLENGVATLRGVSFEVPGASALLDGTYHLITRKVDLRGKVYLSEKLSEATTGVKSFLLKALDPFFRKKRNLSVVAVRITGKYGETSIGFDR